MTPEDSRSSTIKDNPIIQPNNDWNKAVSFWETTLPADLFQNFLLMAEISPFIKGSFIRYPQYCAEFLVWQAQVADKDFAEQLDVGFKEFSSANSMVSEQDIMKGLRIFRRSQAAALAVLELSNKMDIESSCLRISLLAEQMIKAAYRYSRLLLNERFGQALDDNDNPVNLLVLAMGKLGGRELNFSSDIDLIFFYPHAGFSPYLTAGTTKGGGREVDFSRYFQKLATLIIRLLDDVDEEGFVYRVDMRLRPYGESGALVMTLAQAEDYYQEQGREWERFAMVRARVLTGSIEEQTALNKIIQPFCFRRYIDYGVIDSIRNMKSMIVREVRRKGLKDNIKLGAGGIREVEFIAQALQLIQGGRDRRLTERSVFKVLPLIVSAKLLPESVADYLLQSYRYLRRIEHVIQELEEKQTQQLPAQEEARNTIATAMNHESWNSFYAELSSIQSEVHRHFNELLGEERSKGLERDEFYHSLFEEIVSPKQLCDKASEQFSSNVSEQSAEAFIAELSRFLNSPQVTSLTQRGAERIKTFFPALLEICLGAEMPEISLARSLTIIQAILKRTAYLDLLSENPPILEHLVDLAGKSEWIVKRLSEHPILFDELLYPNSLYEPLQTADLESELRQSLLRTNHDDEEGVLDNLRSFKQINELRVAAALLAERLSISQVSRYLTQLAQVVLDASLELAWKMVSKRHGKPQGLADDDTGFAVIGYGKLGGMELGFGSDLDLVFLFNQSVDESTDGDRALNNSRFYTRLAQKLIHILSTRTNQGFLYEVDMRLRPSGASGLLVSHIQAYQDYQMESAWTWEHQALIRARFVAGDYKLLPQFEKARDLALKKSRSIETLKSDVAEMRVKMRSQLEKTESGKVDLKQAPGGLVDIEFIAQYLCLSYLGNKSLPHNTVDCLKFCQEEELVEKDKALILIKNYRIFRNQLNESALMNRGVLVDQELYKEKIEEVLNIWNVLLGFKKASN